MGKAKGEEGRGVVDYGLALRAARAARGMTQRQVADAAGTTSGYISYIESNCKSPSTEMLESLAKALRLPVWLLVALGSPMEELGPEVAPLLPTLLSSLVASRN